MPARPHSQKWCDVPAQNRWSPVIGRRGPSCGFETQSPARNYSAIVAMAEARVAHVFAEKRLVKVVEAIRPISRRGGGSPFRAKNSLAKPPALLASVSRCLWGPSPHGFANPAAKVLPALNEMKTAGATLSRT